MDNNKVQLKTIINEDGTTTFLVLRPDGEYTVLTWSDISNKPFNSINDLQFIVVDGVLKIRDTTLSKSWNEVTDKPFITLSPTDFEVVNNELRYKGIPQWNEISDKPFNSVNSDDFDTSGGVLKLVPKQTESVGWIDVQSKPFESVSNSDFNVVGNELQIKKESLSIDWSQIASKPFNQVGDGLKVEDNTLKAIPPAAPDWNTLQNKPFNQVGDGLKVEDNTLKANVDITNTWSQVTDKPFSSIGSGLSVDGSGVLSAQGGQGGTTIYSASLFDFLTGVKDNLGQARVLNGYNINLRLPDVTFPSITAVEGESYQAITITQINNVRLINCPCFLNNRFGTKTANLGIIFEIELTGTTPSSGDKEFILYCMIKDVDIVNNNNVYTLTANAFIFDKSGRDAISLSSSNLTFNLTNNFLTVLFIAL